MDKLDRIIKESIKNVLIKEISINAKKRNIKDIENAFEKGKSGYNGIKCFAVFTAENQDSTPQTSAENKRQNHELLRALKQGQYVIIPSKGKFGSEEHSYVVININLETVMYYCGKAQQTSFIFSILNDGKVISQYFEKNNPELPYNDKENPYVIKDESEEWVNMKNADDFYTIVGDKFKYSIPFSIFENVNKKINHNLNRILSKDGKKIIKENKDSFINRTINKVGMSPYLWRKSLYKDLI